MRRFIHLHRGNVARAGRVPPRGVSVATTVVSATFASILVGAAGATGCLPGDTRPVPERVDVMVEPGPLLKSGIDTVDGWRIRFDRFLVALGHIELHDPDDDPYDDPDSDGGDCDIYAEARYDRLFDFTVAEREKVGTVYGLGRCRIEIQLADPSPDVLLGPGATESDAAFMRAPRSAPYAASERVSVFAIGSAVRGQTTKRFAWDFRRYALIPTCSSPGGLMTELSEASSSELRIEIRPEVLFGYEGGYATLRFQRIADADADEDGVVTLDELSKATLPVGRFGVFGGEGGASGAGGAGAGDAGAVFSVPLVSVLYGALNSVAAIMSDGPCFKRSSGAGSS